MNWNPSHFQVTDESPNLEFHHPVLWKATKLLGDSAGESYAVASAFDLLSSKPVFISGNSGEMVQLIRVFLSTQNGWELVKDKGMRFAARRLAEGSNQLPEPSK